MLESYDIILNRYPPDNRLQSQEYAQNSQENSVPSQSASYNNVTDTDNKVRHQTEQVSVSIQSSLAANRSNPICCL